MFETLIWSVPAAVFVAGARWPRAGLLIFAATLPLFGAPPGGPYLGALDASALAAIVTGLRGRAPSERSSLDLGVLAVLAVALASFFPVAYRPPSWSPDALLGLLAVFPGIERWNVLFTWRALANLLLGVGLYFAVKRSFSDGSVRALGWALGAGLSTGRTVPVRRSVSLGLFPLGVDGGVRRPGEPVCRRGLARSPRSVETRCSCNHRSRPRGGSLQWPAGSMVHGPGTARDRCAGCSCRVVVGQIQAFGDGG